MTTVAITGAASGIGAAVRTRLLAGGTRVIGVDVRDADVEADLATGAGRDAAIARVRELARGELHGLVACAGLGPHVPDGAAIASVNYFGAVALLGGLRDALAGVRGAAVAVSSNSSTLPGSDNAIAAACLAGDEPAARALAAESGGQPAYGGSKRALALWVRHQAPRPEWAGAGVRLNAIAPGAVMTPLLRDGLEHPTLGAAIRNFPIPTGGFGSAEQIAAAIVFLLGPDAAFCCGSVLFVDGGTDALFRPDRY